MCLGHKKDSIKHLIMLTLEKRTYRSNICKNCARDHKYESSLLKQKSRKLFSLIEIRKDFCRKLNAASEIVI